MQAKNEGEQKRLSDFSNRDIVSMAVRQESPTALEVELALRLEAFIEIHGDYMTEV